MSSHPKVVLWSKAGCHFCGEVKSYLESKNQPYDNIDVEGHDVLRDVLEIKYGIRHVPVIEVGNNDTFHALLKPDLALLETLLNESTIAVES